MAFHIRHPEPIAAAPKRGAWAFALLFFLESVARATVSTVIPLEAYALLGDKQSVSFAYFGVAIVALAFSFSIPAVIHRISRRWTYTTGGMLTVACGLLMLAETAPTQVLAMLTRTVGAAALNITLNLYIMDNIPKNQLVRSEPLRYGVSTVAWTASPLAGVWLFQEFGVWATVLLSVVAVAAMLAAFWWLRMSDGGPIRAARSVPPNPLASLHRFIAQPRLRLAWLIAFGRSSFWVTFFVYVPILILEGGLKPIHGGIAIAAGNVMLFNNLALPWMSRFFALRQMLTAAFLLSAVTIFAAAVLAPSNALAAAVLLVVASFFVSMLDGLGPIPFLRAVRMHERPQMTTVYRTYLDMSELLPQLVYFVIFLQFGLGVAFAALAMLFAGIGMTVWRYLPRRL